MPAALLRSRHRAVGPPPFACTPVANLRPPRSVLLELRDDGDTDALQHQATASVFNRMTANAQGKAVFLGANLVE